MPLGDRRDLLSVDDRSQGAPIAVIPLHNLSRRQRCETRSAFRSNAPVSSPTAVGIRRGHVAIADGLDSMMLESVNVKWYSWVGTANAQLQA